MELGHESREQEEEGAETEDREDIRGEDDEGFAGDRENRRDAVDGKDDVGELDEDEREQERRPHETARFPDQEFPVVQGRGDRKELLEEAEDDILRRIGMRLGTEGDLETGECQEDSEEERHPGDLHEHRTEGDEDATEDHGSKDAVEEDLVTIL